MKLWDDLNTAFYLTGHYVRLGDIEIKEVWEEEPDEKHIEILERKRKKIAAISEYYRNV